MLTAKQNDALQRMLAGQNIFLSGEAGTGKSFVLREFLANTNRKVVVCAPTGVAAIHVSGSTLHRIFKIPMEPIGPRDIPGTPQEVIVNADTIVIDEVSMCRFDVFEYVAKEIRKAEEQSSKKQVIVVGDFLQLPPVITDADRQALNLYWGKDFVKDGFAFQAPLWSSFEFATIILDEVVRQKDNSEFVLKLNDIRKGKADAIDWFNRNHAPKQPGICICSTNKEAESINAHEIDKLNGRSRTYRAEIVGEVTSTDKPTSDLLTIKTGMRVMSIINSKDGTYQNGTMGTVKAIDSRSIIVAFDNGHWADILPYTWEIIDYKVVGKEIHKETIGAYTQFPLKAAYAITIHKSQGQTYEMVNVLPSCFADGQLYVALSRCKSIEHLHLVYKIRYKDLRTSKDVLDFYQNNGS